MNKVSGIDGKNEICGFSLNTIRGFIRKNYGEEQISKEDLLNLNGTNITIIDSTIKFKINGNSYSCEIRFDDDIDTIPEEQKELFKSRVEKIQENKGKLQKYISYIRKYFGLKGEIEEQDYEEIENSDIKVCEWGIEVYFRRLKATKKCLFLLLPLEQKPSLQIVKNDKNNGKNKAKKKR